MRWLGAIAVCALTTACLRSGSHTCGSGSETWLCPENLTCADPPGYCGTPSLIEQCRGKDDYTPCNFTDTTGGACVGHICTECTVDLGGCTVQSWAAMTSNTMANLDAVWAATNTDVFAAGDQTMMHYDGISWSAQAFPTLPTDAIITGLWGTSGHDVYATAGGAVFHYDGSAWSPEASSPRGLQAITGAADVITAVGLNATITQRAQMQWMSTQGLLGLPVTFNGVWSDAPTNIFVAGSSGVIVRYDGSWTTSRPAPGPKLAAIWGSAGDDVYAVGDAGASDVTIYHFVGGVWTSESLGQLLNLASVWGIAGKVFACGAGHVLERASGTWTVMTSPTTSTLRAISGSPAHGTPPATEMFAVGANGVIWRQTEPL